MTCNPDGCRDAEGNPTCNPDSYRDAEGNLVGLSGQKANNKIETYKVFETLQVYQNLAGLSLLQNK